MRFRHLAIHFILSIACLLLPGRLCHAQFRERTSFDLDWDLRTRLASGGKAQSGLYSGSFRLKTGLLGPGWTVELYGARKDSDMLTLRSSSDLVWQQATVEKEWGSNRIQAGEIRLPFGIYDTRETYASGLIDYPMARGDYALNSVDWGVPGVKWAGGSSRFQVEASAFNGLAAGTWGNLNMLCGGALRVQTYVNDLIIGVSHWDGYIGLPQYKGPGYGSSGTDHTGVQMNGLDIRYTRPHLLLRGEFLIGRLGGQQMNGWYLDLYYHLPKYEKWTFVTRIEGLRPGSGVGYGRQITLGVRYILSRDWLLAVNWRRNNLDNAYRGSWTPATGRSGDVFFQVYRKIRW